MRGRRGAPGFLGLELDEKAWFTARLWRHLTTTKNKSLVCKENPSNTENPRHNKTQPHHQSGLGPEPLTGAQGGEWRCPHGQRTSDGLGEGEEKNSHSWT